MGLVTRFEFYMGFLQILLCIIIARSSYLAYSRSTSKAAKYRMMIFGIAFVVYALKITFRVYHPEATPLEPSLILFLQHSLGVIFFILLGTIGLLYFVKTGLRERVKKASYLLVGLILLFDLLYSLVAATNPLVLKYSLDLSKVLHVIQILVLAFVTAVILRRITTVGRPSLLTLPLKYPFGFGVVLLMLADMGHILNLTILKGVMELTLLEYVLTTIALGIITWKVHEISKIPVLIKAREEISKDEAAIIDNTLRQVYYGLSYIDVGERDMVFVNFLDKTRLKAVFDRENIGIKVERVHEAISRNPDFLFDVAMGMLSYFKENPQSIGELQTYYLTEYLGMLHSLTEEKNRRECPVCNKRSCLLYSHYRDGSREGHARYAELWKSLSEVYRNEAHKYSHHFDKLRNWGVLATNAYFETEHSTGSRSLDGRIKIPSRGFALNIRDAKIDKKLIFEPVLLKNLADWRNIIYVSSDPLEKMLMDFETLKGAVSERRLTLISLSTRTSALWSPYQNCYQIKESSVDLMGLIDRLVRTLPMSSIILAIDLNPLVIKESPKEVHNFLTELMEGGFLRNVTVFASISGNMNPVSMDILEDRADVIINYSLLDGSIVSTVLKPALGERAVLKKELYELLQFVNQENSQGREPNFNDVKEKLRVTSVTTRRRINQLIHGGMLKVRKKGRSKTLRITNRGRETLFARRV